MLNVDQVAAYERDGYLAPVQILEPSEADHYRACFDRFVDEWAEPIRRAENLHRVYPWAFALASRPRDMAAQLLAPGLEGTDLLIWGTLAFCKYPQSKGFVAWHQDSAYTDFLDGAPSVTAWIALTRSTAENGCMRVSPGTHLTRLTHGHNTSPDNLLRQQQQLDGHHDDNAVELVLEPGEMSFHHLNLIHGSNPNVSDERRIGFIIRFTTAKLGGLVPDQSPADLIGTDDRPQDRSREEALVHYRRITNRPK